MKYQIKDLFSEAKNRLDIKTVAERYGIIPDRHGKALCPFHEDKHPSLSFKDNYFKCFSCNISGDVFTLVGHILGINKPFEVLKKLNSDFNLGLNLTPHRHTAAEKKQESEKLWRHMVQNAYNNWLNNALMACIEYEKFLTRWREIYKPKNMQGAYHPLFVSSMQNSERIGYLLDILMFGSETEKIVLYKNCYSEVMKIECRVNEIRHGIFKPCCTA